LRTGAIRVRDILLSTATDHACPAGGIEDYTAEGRPAEFNAICDGTSADNGLYGEGIVNALAACNRVPRPRAADEGRWREARLPRNVPVRMPHGVAVLARIAEGALS
jgi:hypothetical protein